MNYRLLIGTHAAMLALGMLAGHGLHGTPAKVVTVDHTVYVDRVVTKTATAATRDTDAKVVTVAGPVVVKWRRYPAPDCKGEYVTEKTTTSGPDTTTKDTRTDAKSATVATVDSSRQGDTWHSTTITNRPDWLVSARGGAGLSLAPVYGGSIERRIVGSIYAGLWADSRLTGGVGVTCAF